MKPLGLLQAGGLSEVQRAVQSHFERGGSGLAVLCVLVILAAVVLTAYLLTRRQQASAEATAQGADPKKLYRDLLNGLGLRPDQRRLMHNVSRDIGLEHPTVILLSSVLFDRYVGGWLSAREEKKPDPRRSSNGELAAELRGVLFPPA